MFFSEYFIVFFIYNVDFFLLSFAQIENIGISLSSQIVTSQYYGEEFGYRGEPV